MASINSLYNIDNPTLSSDNSMQEIYDEAKAEWESNWENWDDIWDDADGPMPEGWESEKKEFSMSTYIDDALNKDGKLSKTQLEVLTMHYGLDSDTTNENIAERVNNVRRQTETEEKELRNAIDQIQNNPEIQQEYWDYQSERKQRQAVKAEETYRTALDKEVQSAAKEQALKDANSQARQAWKNRRTEFLGDLSYDENAVFDKNDPFFKLSGQDELEKVYKTTHNTRFKDEYIRGQLDKGVLEKQYKGFDFSDGLKNLTKEQRARIESDYDKLVESRFERYTAPDGKLDWERGELSRRLAASPELTHNAYGKDSLFAVDKTKPIKTGGYYDKSLNAYRDYLSKNIDNAKEDILGLDDFLSKREALTKKQIDMAKKDLQAAGHVLSSSASDGIKASSKLKGLKVAGGIAGGLVALWALSEIYDE